MIRHTSAFIDLIENGKARIVPDDEAMLPESLPLSWLPDGIKESDNIDILITINPEAKQREYERAEELLGKLRGVEE